MQDASYKAGDVLFREGAPSDYAYKIVSGRVGILFPGAAVKTYKLMFGRMELRLNGGSAMRRDKYKTAATCGPGEFVGEMGLIDGLPRSATAVALEPTRCIAYTAPELVRMLENQPEEAMQYIRVLLRRLRKSNRVGSAG